MVSTVFGEPTVKVGDRVKPAEGTSFCALSMGQDNIGTVIIIKTHNGKELKNPEVGVQWDKKIPSGQGHSCAGWANGAVYKDGHCRWGMAKELIVIGHGEEIQPEYWILNGKIIKGMTPVEDK